jgi:HEAT repeat protein
MIRKLLIATLVVTGLVSFVGSIRAHVNQDEMQTLLRQLRSEDIDEREAAAKALTARKQEVINSPDAIAKIEAVVGDFAGDENRRGTAKTAIDLLGNLQSTGSIPVLVNNLTLRVFYKETKRPQRKEDLYPSVGALIKMGEPSTDPVLTRVQESDDDQVAQCTAYVVKGLKKNGAAQLIQDHINRQSDSRANQRLRAVQRYMGGTPDLQ